MIPLLYRAVAALWPIIVVEAEQKHVDPYTLAAIVFVESRGLSSAVRHETNGSCSVGPAGINVPECRLPDAEILAAPSVNLRHAAAILQQAKLFCREHPKDAVCRRGGAIARYNPGDKGYTRRVRDVRRKLRLVLRRR